jgi:transcriptional regulator with XRE-family HTH domain
MPKADRAFRDLARRRMQLVGQRTSQIVSIETSMAQHMGAAISGNSVKALTADDIDAMPIGPIEALGIRDQIPLREIARRLGISRNTVRRYLRSETTEPTYAERRIASGLDKYSVQLSGWLKAETSKPRKQRRSLKQLHADLKELGYEGSYDRVAAFARQWKAGQTELVNSSSKRTW